MASWDPPREVVLLWQIGADWQYDPDFRTEVEVSFTAEGSGHTRLDLRHRNLPRYGDNDEQMRAIFDDPSGWTGVLARFLDLLSADRPTSPRAEEYAVTTTQMACEEREDFADLLAGLSAAQWKQPSLCARWRVRDVVAHVLSFDELSRWQLVGRFVKGGFWPPRINAIGVAEYAARSPEQLAEPMRACIPPRGFTAAFGGMIHQQDIRRPLGIPRLIPEQPYVPCSITPSPFRQCVAPAPGTCG